MGQSGEVAFRIGHRTGWRELEPDLPTVWLPCFVRRIEIVAAAGGENGTVVATALLDFGPRPPHFGYDPPQLTLQLYPRRWAGDPRVARFFRKDGRLRPLRG